MYLKNLVASIRRQQRRTPTTIRNGQVSTVFPYHIYNLRYDFPSWTTPRPSDGFFPIFQEQYTLYAPSFFQIAARERKLPLPTDIQGEGTKTSRKQKAWKCVCVCKGKIIKVKRRKAELSGKVAFLVRLFSFREKFPDGSSPLWKLWQFFSYNTKKDVTFDFFHIWCVYFWCNVYFFIAILYITGTCCFFLI